MNKIHILMEIEIYFSLKKIANRALSIFLHQSHVHSDLKSENCFFFLKSNSRSTYTKATKESVV